MFVSIVHSSYMIHRIRILLRLQTECAVLEILGASLAGNGLRTVRRLGRTFLVRWVDLCEWKEVLGFCYKSI